jgi:hypothetical protein
MCNTNDALKFGRGNGTLCRCIKVRMKHNASVQWKNWDGRKVNTTSVDQIEWIEFELSISLTPPVVAVVVISARARLIRTHQV